MTASKIIHWDSKTCPYAQRSWITLLEKQVPFEIREVDLQNKDEEFKAKYASIHPDPTAPAKVPILQDTDGTELIESLVVARYLNDKFPEPALLPKAPADAAKVNLFIELFSVPAKAFACAKVDNRADLEEARLGLVEALKQTDLLLTRLGSTKGGNYFLGDQYTLADIATSTLAHRSILLLKSARDIDVPAIIKEEKLHRIAAWLEAVHSRPSFVQTAPSDEVVAKGMSRFVTPLKD